MSRLQEKRINRHNLDNWVIYGRSESMDLYQLIMQADDAWATINELGKLECLHFIDLNKDKLSYE